MPVRSVVPVMVSAVMPFPSFPAIVMPMVRLVVLMAALVVMVTLTVFAMTCPNVTAQYQYESNQNDSDEYEFPCHVNLLCVGLNKTFTVCLTRKTGGVT